MASCFFQPASGHAAIGSYLTEKAKTIQSGECWWCGSAKQQSRHQLPSLVPQIEDLGAITTGCMRPFVPRTNKNELTTQIEDLWKGVRKACQRRHPRAPSVRLLSQDERVLTFLRETKVGRMSTLVPPEEECKKELEG